MERFFILDKFNTWYDWNLVLTDKDITPPVAKTNYIELDGMSGTLDLSEALTGEVAYKDRTISASFWTDTGTRADRDRLIRKMISFLHGKKIQIIEPDDPYHYYYGRVSVKSYDNTQAYATIKIEAICDPWRYSLESIERHVTVTSDTPVDLIIINQGVKTVSPTITATGNITIVKDDSQFIIPEGTSISSSLKLYQGINLLHITGNGSITFSYREGDL